MNLKRFLSIAACVLLTMSMQTLAESLNSKIPADIVTKINNKQQLTNLPTIYLTVPDAIGQDINSVLKKTGNVAEYHAATIQVVDNTGRIGNFTDSKLEIKVRGNSTSQDGKRPYRLKFAKDVKDAAGNVIETHKHDMLGLGYKKRNWTLLTNHKDKSLLHNALTYHVGQAVGMPFCPGYQFVDLVINGEYRGNYQLSDHCEVGKNRIDVDEETGWFIEAARGDMVEEPLVEAAGLRMSIKNPEPANAAETAALKAEVYNYFTRLNHFWGIYSTPCSMEEFVNAKTGWRAYIDEESLVNFYVGINLTDDYDGFMTVKMYREADGKLMFGPLWDKDLAYGNWQNHGKLAETYQTGYTFCDHMARMMTDPYFVKKVHDKLHTVVDAGFVANMKAKIKEMGETITASQKLNQNIWWTCDDYPAAYNEFASYIEEHTKFFVSAIDEKYKTMCSNLPPQPGTEIDPGPVSDLGSLLELGNGKYSFIGSASTFKEGTVITITTSGNSSISNYITEGSVWNTVKTITLSANDVKTLAANKYTFFMNTNGGEVLTVNVKVPTTASGAEFNKELSSSYTSSPFVVPSSYFNANATSIKVKFKNNADNYKNGWNGNYAFNGTPWNGYNMPWTLTQTYETTITDPDEIKSAAQKGMGVSSCDNMTITIINYGKSTSPSIPQCTLSIQTTGSGTATGSGTYDEGTTVLIKAIANEGYKFVQWSDENTNAVRSVTLTQNLTLQAIFASEGSPVQPTVHQQLTNLPTIYLSAETISDEWLQAAIEVFDKNNVFGRGAEWTIEGVSKKGNVKLYTQYQGSGKEGSKNSYRLKFNDKIGLLSAGDYKQWVLSSNDDDPTMINNALAKELGDGLGLPFTPGYQFVDLYVNETYTGTYQLTDRIKAEDGRALVSGGNKDLDWHVRFNDKTEIKENELQQWQYIAGDKEIPFVIPKNPDPDDLAADAIQTLKSDMATYFQSLFAKDDKGHYTAFANGVDQQQLFQWYIAQEILCVYKGFSSIEAYRSVTETAADQKLHIGVLWDSEKGFGNTGENHIIDMDDLNTPGSNKGLMTEFAAYTVMKNLFVDLWQQPWFAEGVKALWDEKQAALLSDLTAKANSISATLYDSQAKNAEVWSEKSPATTEAYQQSVGKLTSYLDTRFKYLDKKFAYLTGVTILDVPTMVNYILGIGTGTEGYKLADLNGDHVVDTQDLVILINAKNLK